MRIVLLSVVALVFVLGCKKQPDEDVVKSTPALPPGAAKAGPQGGITPLGAGAGAGGMTPVTGTESLTGTSGGGVAQVAKERARGTQNKASTATNEEEGEGGSGDQ